MRRVDNIHAPHLHLPNLYEPMKLAAQYMWDANLRFLFQDAVGDRNTPPTYNPFWPDKLIIKFNRRESVGDQKGRVYCDNFTSGSH